MSESLAYSIDKEFEMTRAIFMTNEQLEQLAHIAKEDRALWQHLKDRELEGEKRYAAARAQGKWPDSPDVILEPLMRTSWDELMVEFLRRQYAPDFYRFDRGELTMALRKEIRIELDLPV